MESKTDNDNAVFWVEVSDNLSAANVTIYIYYGNATATTTSNAVNTFIVGELFPDATHWTPLAGTWSLVAGEGNFPPAYKGVHDGTAGARKSSLSNYSPPADFRLLSRVKSSVDNSLANIVFRAYDNTNDGNDRIWVRLDQRATSTSHYGGFHCFEDVAGTEYNRGYYDFDPVLNQWYHWEILVVGSTVKGYLDDTLRWTATVSRTAAGYLLVQVEYQSGHDAFFDYICIAKFVDPEPAHGSWGSEETSGQQVSKTVVEYVGLSSEGDFTIDNFEIADFNCFETYKTLGKIRKEYAGLLDIRSRVASLHRIFYEYVGLIETRMIQKSLHKIFVEYLGLKDDTYKRIIALLKRISWRYFQHPKQHVEVEN